MIIERAVRPVEVDIACLFSLLRGECEIDTAI